MRWIEIDITQPCDETSELFGVIAARQQELPRLQKDVGLDSPVIVRFFEEQGQLLFRAIQLPMSDALQDVVEGEDVGLQILTTSAWLGLPWHALHNGIHFLIEKTPLCADTTALCADGDATGAAWKRRWRETQLTEAALGPVSADEIIARYRPEPCAEAEILFVDGRSATATGQEPWAEHEVLGEALNTVCGSTHLGRLITPDARPTPSTLMRRGPFYQAIHYSNATYRAPQPPGGVGAVAWNRLVEAPEADKEILGVDPVTALLDEVSESVERRRENPLAPQAETNVAVAAPAWELEDGPVRPEDLGRHEAAPPLVFANSHLSLESFGARFLAAGSQAFVGTHALVTPKDARAFVADFYQALAEGRSVADAHRNAVLEARARRGSHHPLWMSYGLLGAGALALQYL